MKLFLNDIKINIKKDVTTVKTTDYNFIFSTFKDFDLKLWEGNVLLLFPDTFTARKIFDQLETGINFKVSMVTVICHKPKDFIAKTFKDFNTVEAGGGIVTNTEGKFLMIYRNGIWDFPKGKLDKGEKILDCAVREVSEECNVKVKIKSFICKTRHTYVGSKKRVLKTTYWYKMDLVSDAKMKPQKDEGIEKVEWKSENEVIDLLQYSFESLKYLFEKFQSIKGTYAETSFSNR